MKFRIEIRRPSPSAIAAYASTAKAHAFGAALNYAISYERNTPITVRPKEGVEGCYEFVNQEGEVVAETHQRTKRKAVQAEPLPSIRQPGRRSRTGWYWWENRDPEKLPKPLQLPPRPDVGLRTDRYAYGFYNARHEFIGHAVANYTPPPSPRRGLTLRDCIPPPHTSKVPEGAYYVVVVGYEYRGKSQYLAGKPIMYGLVEDFT